MADQEERKLNPEESLRLIRETIDLAKNRVRENGFQFLLWGWLVVIASLTNYWLVTLGFAYGKANLVWMVMPVIGVPASLIYERFKGSRYRDNNIVSKWYGLVWLGFAVALGLSLVLAVRMNVSPIPLILILAGFSTYLSGILLRFNALIAGGIVLWIGAAACIYLPWEIHVLVQAGAIVLGYLVPGYLMNAQVRKAHA